jgi:hypothetical protein
MTIAPTPEFFDDAACRALGALDVFYEAVNVNEAKAICQTCSVQTDCLNWAIEVEDWDAYVLGGLTIRERERYCGRRRRKVYAGYYS